jgi:peptide/nickel transport system permease protein
LYIFGGGIKSYRAIFLQVKESGYIEAAKAYGATNIRIIGRYLIPRIIPTLIPSLVTYIPTFVFYEAALNVLGLGDPTLPTWGKVINDAYVNGALHQGQYYWILEPSILLMITGLAFSLFGFALDRIFNPRLRGM